MSDRKRGSAFVLLGALAFACAEPSSEVDGENEFGAQLGTGGQRGDTETSTSAPGGQGPTSEDEPTPCEGLGKEECEANDSCQLLAGLRLDRARQCWEALSTEPPVCVPVDVLCSDAVGYAISPDGECWMFGSGCGSREAWQGWQPAGGYQADGEGGQGGEGGTLRCGSAVPLQPCP